jgi:hypothetical protein
MNFEGGVKHERYDKTGGQDGMGAGPCGCSSRGFSGWGISLDAVGMGMKSMTDERFDDGKA